MDQEYIRIPARILAEYGIGIADRLLVIRGSGSVLGFPVSEPIVEEVKRYGELFLFEP